MKFLNVLVTSIFIILSCSAKASANQFEIFKSTWKYFIQECALALEDPEKYELGKIGSKEKITFKKTKDKKVTILNKGNGKLNRQTRYVELIIRSYPDREVRSCGVDFQKYRIFKAKKLSEKAIPWLENEFGLNVGGGLVSLYDQTSHQFAVLGAWPKHDLPMNIAIYDWGIQFHVSHIVKTK